MGVNVQGKSCDIVIVGAGIAGASIAAELSSRARVLLLERESQPGYHTTGRSAALYSSIYGPPIIRALTRASGHFFNNPDSRFIETGLLRPRGLYFIARKDQSETFEKTRLELGGGVVPVSLSEAKETVPILRAEYVDRVLMEKGCADIEVDLLHQHYLKTFKSQGGDLLTSCEVQDIEKSSDGWRISTNAGIFNAPIVVNAAGAWADDLARLAKIKPIGLVPKRRTALLVSPPADQTIDHWPMIVDIDEQFYMKPDAGKLLLSPADETPSQPCDAQPEDLDVAICIDRIEKAFDLSVRYIDHKWAGLRNFVADKCPVVGYDSQADGFFWLAGQGGYGIQSAPALSRMAAALVMGDPLPDDIQDEGVVAADLSPDRAGLSA
nr:FAD-binding oxidoreductase [Sneathiella aquimaris]